MSSSESKSQRTISPLVYPPAQEHKTTIIILHGRGSTALKFAQPLLSHEVSPADTAPATCTGSPGEASLPSKNSFQDHFPNTKFIFPTAPLRRAVVFKRSVIHQWFDNWSLTEPELKQHLQAQGLRETSAYIHDLLKDEIEIVGASNVVLMGLSQGCAASIVAMLLWTGEPIRALVGMCGYLPFRKGMHDSVEDTEYFETESLLGSDGGQEDMFERDDDASGSGSKFERAVHWLREELGIDFVENGLDGQDGALQSTPVFMGHGRDDEKVPCHIGKLAADFLRGIQVNVQWQEYSGLGHWYSEDMLRDVIAFLDTPGR
jgi:predicted esterase